MTSQLQAQILNTLVGSRETPLSGIFAEYLLGAGIQAAALLLIGVALMVAARRFDLFGRVVVGLVGVILAIGALSVLLQIVFAPRAYLLEHVLLR